MLCKLSLKAKQRNVYARNFHEIMQFPGYLISGIQRELVNTKNVAKVFKN